MPTVLREDPYRIYFYSHEPNEPPHVHIDRDNLSVKFWISPVALARNLGFSPKEMQKIARVLTKNEDELLEAWHERFGD
ncbi:MAG: DUF4160 domain-containing protein [Chloroflexi bacterium]|nr:DUF4160 domain-containing protein [Chloroflexota bacterium]